MLRQASTGDQKAISKLMPIVYDELRRLARGYLRRERRPHTIRATALVHDAYLRLAKDKRQNWRGHTHFLPIGAIAMRRISVEWARARAASKRGGSRARVALNEELVADDSRPAQLVALASALTRLAGMAPERARIVELRFLGGLTIEETADTLAVSPATVKRGCTLAKTWLRREMREGSSSGF